MVLVLIQSWINSLLHILMNVKTVNSKNMKKESDNLHFYILRHFLTPWNILRSLHLKLCILKHLLFEQRNSKNLC